MEALLQAREPLAKTNAEYWRAKIARNVERHSERLDELAATGCTGLTLWECELADMHAVARHLRAFLDVTVSPYFVERDLLPTLAAIEPSFLGRAVSRPGYPAEPAARSRRKSGAAGPPSYIQGDRVR